MPNVPNSTALVDNLAHGLDRNDGTGGKGGTASLPLQIVVRAAGGVTSIDNIPIEEHEDSPTIERAEQCTVTHNFSMAYSEAINRLSIYGRGALVADSNGNYYRVLSSSCQRQKGGRGLFTVVSESISFDAPPDLFSCHPVKLGLDIMKHPRYFSALMPTNQINGYTGVVDTDPQIAAKQSIIRAIQAYKENPFIPTSQNLAATAGTLHDGIMASFVGNGGTYAVLNKNWNAAKPTTAPPKLGETFAGGLPYPPAWAANGDKNPQYYYSYFDSSVDPNGRVTLALAAARELLGKLWRMEDSPIIHGVEITHTEFWFRPPPINLGGYVEDPTAATPPLPDYFYSTSYPPNAAFTIFDKLADFNPQCYSITGKKGGGAKISWLRDADEIDYERTWFKVTRRWLGAPIGSWDEDINSSKNRPSIPSDYRNLILA